MMQTQSKKTLPQEVTGDRNPPPKQVQKSSLDFGGALTSCREESELPNTSSNIKPKRKFLIGTFNTNTLLKPGKQKHLTDTLERHKIAILALQETRFLTEETVEIGNYRCFKGKPAQFVKGTNNTPLLGTAFLVQKQYTESIIDFTSESNRLSTLTIKSGNKAYTLINAHAPTNVDNKKNREKVDDFWEDLEKVTEKIPLNNIKIILGDFNAQIGKEKKHRKTVGDYPAHKRTNTNGERLIRFCRQFNLKIMSTNFKRKPKQQKTWKSPIESIGEFQIDHVAISFRNQREIQNVRVKRGYNLESDHYLTQIKMKFIPNRNKKIIPRAKPRIDVNTLKINKEKYKQELENMLSDDWDSIQTLITQTAQKHGIPPRRRRKVWWNETCDRMIEIRKQCHQIFDSNKTPENLERFKLATKLASKAFRQERRKFNSDQIKEIDIEFTRHNSQDFYRNFAKQLKGYVAPSLCIKKPNGKLALNNKENCDLFAQYFRELLNCEPPKEKLDFSQDDPEPNPPRDLTFAEFTEIIKELKNNRAPGEDNILAEMWKISGQSTLTNLYKIILRIIQTKTLPESWKMALIHPLHKKGDKKEVNNYRGISLLQVTYKILSKILLRWIEPQVDHQIGEYQGGFRKHRSCVEQIFNLKTILGIQALRSKNTVVVFVDFQKAYDSIDRQTLFKILKQFSVDTTTRELIEQTLTNTFSKVKFLGEISEAFEIKTGVRQGDGLSPILFNLVLETIMRRWEDKMKSDEIHGARFGRPSLEIRSLAFADDLALIANNREDAQNMVETLHEIAIKTGLKISYEKTEYIERKHNGEKFMNTKFGKIYRTEKFRYLGEWIQSNGGDTITNHERIKKFENIYRLTFTTYNKRNLSINAKFRHYETVVRTLILYGSECLTLSKKGQRETLCKKERQILRKILGPIQNSEGTWIKRHTEELYKNIEEIISVMKKRRLRFTGHLTRMDRNRLTKKIFDYAMKLKASTTWVKEVKKDLEKFNISEIADRKTFRNLVNNIYIEPNREVIMHTGTKWTQDRKDDHSKKMKKWWEQRRNTKKKS